MRRGWGGGEAEECVGGSCLLVVTVFARAH
jgi:hypothetical protein